MSYEADEGDVTVERADGIATIDVASDAIVDIFESETPYVASFEKVAIGGGIEFGVACDLRVAGESIDFRE
jgi:enoyl-CoA hydratase/carnithine racemase